MEGLTAVKELLQEGDWMSTIDLKDTYLSALIVKEHRKLLRLIWEGKTFQFICLPFGLCTAPWVFTKLLHPVMAHLRRQGLRSVVYLDDLLLLAHKKDCLRSQITQAVNLLEQLRFMVNRAPISSPAGHLFGVSG